MEKGKLTEIDLMGVKEFTDCLIDTPKCECGCGEVAATESQEPPDVSCGCDCGDCKGCDGESDAADFGYMLGPVIIEPTIPKGDFMDLYATHKMDEESSEADYLPQYASEGDSGFDVRAIEDVIIHPGETKLIKLGFKVGIPIHPFFLQGFRFELQCRPRSGVSLKTKLRVANTPGTIDNYYTGEVGVIMTNTSLEIGHPQYINGESAYSYGYGDLNPNCNIYVIKKGDRVAQLVFNEVIRPERFMFGIVEEKRNGGFGSTGIK